MAGRVVNGRQLRAWRLARKWTQNRAAMWAGIAAATLRKWELQGNRKLLPRSLELRIAELRWQEKLLTHIRDGILRAQGAIEASGTLPGVALELAELVAIIEKGGTPDPPQLHRKRGPYVATRWSKRDDMIDPDAGDEPSAGVVFGDFDPFSG